MAKGLRSKCKRANRALIRKNLTEPINRKRQEEMSAALQKEIDERKGSSIRSLKDLLPVGKDSSNVEMAGEQEESEEEEEEVKESGKKKGFTFVRRNPKSKGSKPRSNPGKTLEWFK